MAHSSSPHSSLASPPRYEKSSINQQNNCLRYDQRDPAPRYSSKYSYQAEADLNGLLGINAAAQGPSADDKLPPYAPTLQLLTLCRRKNELDAKDRKAKKRSWDLVWLLLDGTALRMYQPTTAETKKFEREWKEKYCRKGPVKKPAVAPVEREEDEEVETDEEVEVEEVLDVHSTLLEETRTRTPPSHTRGRSSSTAKTPFESTPTPSTSTSRPAPPWIPTSPTASSPASLLNTSPTSPSPPTRPALNLPPHPSLPEILTRKPTISHAVRNISCTRATTYFKRYFVLRFLLEDGKQFLVQLNDHEETLVWQQIVTIAAPLALDIDERDMPEPAPYPRPRRRTAAPSPTPIPTSAPTSTPTLVRRPSTAPGVIDTSRILNVPPEYETSPPAGASTMHADGGMRRRRSFTHSSL